MRTLCLVGFLIVFGAELNNVTAGFITASSFNPKRCFVASARCCIRETSKDEIERASADTSTSTRRDLIQKIAAVATSLATLQQPNAIAATAVSEPSIKTSATSKSKVYSALCDPTVLSFSKGTQVLHIVGTAHISSESADLAGRLVRQVEPDAVFVELDLSRTSRAFSGGIPPPGIRIAVQDEYGNLKLGVTQKTGLVQRLFMKWRNAASNPSVYRKLEMAGIPVGEEFVNAVKAGLECNALIVLGDQKLETTYQRLAQAIATTNPKKLEGLDAKLSEILKEQMPTEWQQSDNLRPDQLREFVETVKTVDTTTQMMNVFQQEVPHVWQAMVGERDVYMARGLNALPFDTIVAVMGLGHLNGVSNSLSQMRWTKLDYSFCQS